ncbi:MAG: hypothetical protein ABIJ33_03055 [Patescibacteria group bacterium]
MEKFKMEKFKPRSCTYGMTKDALSEVLAEMARIGVTKGEYSQFDYFLNLIYFLLGFGMVFSVAFWETIAAPVELIVDGIGIVGRLHEEDDGIPKS